jgi:putative protein-disulfide isomerase
LRTEQTEKAFHEDLKITQSNNANGFPSFLIKSNNGKKVMLRGYQSYDNFKSVIDYLTNGKLTEKSIQVNEDSIFDFISKYGHVSQAEIIETFNLSLNQLDDILQSLNEQNKIKNISAGNGYFITPKSNDISCDPKNGIFNI